MAKPTPKPERVKGGQFAKGTSGNPGGRPRGLMKLVQEKTRDGAMLVDFAVSVVEGNPVVRKNDDGEEKKVYPSILEQLRAVEWLSDRGYGRAVQAVEVTGKDGAPMRVAALGKLTDEELDEVGRAADLVARAAADAGGSSAGEGET